MITKLLEKLSSLNIALFSLMGLLILTFVGTLDQVNLGIYYAQKKYFQSIFLFWEPVSGFKLPVFLGGTGFGILLIINLLAVIWTRKLFQIKKMGLFLVHLGLVILLLGGGLTSMMGIESQLQIEEGQTKSYSVDQRHVELIFSRNVSDEGALVVSFPQDILKERKTLSHEELPFKIKVLRVLANAELKMKRESTRLSDLPEPSQGVGDRVTVKKFPVFVKDDLANMTTALIELFHNDKSLGTWLVSRALGARQSIEVDGKNYDFQIRPARYYSPYSLTLKDFRHDLYPGTNKPKNFSSLLQLKHPEKNEDREVLIYMNHPLRYGGKTYYQASFGKNDTLSILQVVENPSWLLPYISSTLISLGLLWHFMMSLSRFSKRRRS